MKKENNVIGLIGKTPLVKLSGKINPYAEKGIEIFAKLEGFNPSGSIKDRIALKMVEMAEKSGALTGGKTIIEATSGNTGIAISMIAAIKGYEMVVVMPEEVSIERRQLMQAYGAEIILVERGKGTDGAIMKAREIVEEDPEKYFMPDQFTNKYNSLAHYETLANEIIEQVPGDVDYFVTGVGTSGTLMGVGTKLKEVFSDVKVYSVEPGLGHNIQGLKNMNEAIKPQIYDENLLDGKIDIKDDDAFDLAKSLVLNEGIFVGLSSGASLFGALRIAEGMAEKGKIGNIVIIFPDRGERYISTGIFG